MISSLIPMYFLASLVKCVYTHIAIRTLNFVEGIRVVKLDNLDQNWIIPTQTVIGEI